MNIIGIVGLGQIGGSLIKKLMELNISVIGFDIDRPTLKAARLSGIPLAQNLLEIVKKSSIIFCCVSISTNEKTISCLIDISRSISKFPIISDVASYKSGVLPELSEVVQVIPGHPMAGSHGSGFLSSSSDLFNGAVWNLIVDKKIPEDGLIDLINVINNTGANVHFCSKRWHDETVSLVSGLPHVSALSVSLVVSGLIDADNRLVLAAGSFKSATRVMLSDPKFFADLLRYNKPTLLPFLNELQSKLSILKDSLCNSDSMELDILLSEARSKIDNFYNSHWISEKVSLTFSEIPIFLLDSMDKGILIHSIDKSQGFFVFETLKRLHSLT